LQSFSLPIVTLGTGGVEVAVCSMFLICLLKEAHASYGRCHSFKILFMREWSK